MMNPGKPAQSSAASETPSLFDAPEWQQLSNSSDAFDVFSAAGALGRRQTDTSLAGSLENVLWQDDPARWLSDPLEAFAQWIRSPLSNHSRGFSDESLKVYGAMWGKFVRYVLSNGFNAVQANEEVIYGFLQTLSQERSDLAAKRSGTQIVRSRDSHGVGRHSRRYLSLLSKVQAHLMKLGLREHNVAQYLFDHTDPEPPRADPIPLKPKSDQNLRILLAQIPSQDWKSVRDRAIVNLVAGSGLTSLQLRFLKDLPDQIDILSHPAWVRPVPARRGYPTPNPVPLSKEAQDVLAAWLSMRRGAIAGDWLFPSTLEGLQMSSSSVYRAVAQAMELATDASSMPLAPHMGPRTLRHTFATRQLQAGRDMTDVQQWLGHRDIRSTAVYQKFVKPRVQPV